LINPLSDVRLPTMMIAAVYAAPVSREKQSLAVKAFGAAGSKDVGKHTSTLNSLVDDSVSAKLLSTDQGVALKQAISKALSDGKLDDNELSLLQQLMGLIRNGQTGGQNNAPMPK
jgi:hypothetical protein